MDADRGLLLGACRQLGMTGFDEARADRLIEFADLLRDWNRRINLVSRRDATRIVSYHLVDSLAAARYLPGIRTAADVGTGGGLPGIPLAIAEPEISFKLVESSTKKCVFLRHAVETLGVRNAAILNERIEQTAQLDCDLIFSRVTGPVHKVVELTRHHLKPGGTLIFYKTSESADEVTRLTDWLRDRSLTISRVDEIVLPLTGTARSFVVLNRNPD